MSADALEDALVGFIRAFGLLQPDRTPCGLELHVSEAHAIAEIGASTALTQNALAARLRLRKSTVSRLVTNLERRGWVARTTHSADGRAHVLSLTAAGVDVATRVRRARARRFEALLADIPATDRAGIVRAVEVLAAAATASAADGRAS